VIDPRLAWFAIGASCSAVMFGWPWHPRFSRIVPRGTRSISFPDPGTDRQPTNPFTGDPVLYCRREYFHSPSTVAECGGPCEAGPEHCDCGQLWRDVPIEPQFPSPRVIPGDTP
jgi:hypothetical protein